MDMHKKSTDLDTGAVWCGVLIITKQGFIGNYF